MFKNVFATACVMVAAKANQDLETYRLMQNLEEENSFKGYAPMKITYPESWHDPTAHHEFYANAKVGHPDPAYHGSPARP